MNRIQSYIYSFIFLALICPNSLYAQVASGTINGHYYVDLGLPSGTLWATCNVGANAPSQWGNYFAWGETSSKRFYSSTNCATQWKSFQGIEGNSAYDAASANWGSPWRMPTEQDAQELVQKCTWVWTDLTGSSGYKVIGPNGNWIFLPAAGSHYENEPTRSGQCGYYWTSSPDTYNLSGAYCFGFTYYQGMHDIRMAGRGAGRSVRPVTTGTRADSRNEIIWKNISQNYNDRPSGILAVAEVGDFCTPDPEDEDMYYNFKSSSSGVFLGNDSSGIVIQGLYLQPDGVSVSAFTLRVNKFGKDYSSQTFIYMGTFDAKGSSAAVVIDFETGYILYRQENGFTLWAENFTIIGDDPSAFEL